MSLQLAGLLCLVRDQAKVLVVFPAGAYFRGHSDLQWEVQTVGEETQHAKISQIDASDGFADGGIHTSSSGQLRRQTTCTAS